jgi:hypothetical protein
MALIAKGCIAIQSTRINASVLSGRPDSLQQQSQFRRSSMSATALVLGFTDTNDAGLLAGFGL